MIISPFGDRESLVRLGDRLKRERLRRNQTQTQAAEWAAVSRATYAKLEAGDGTVQLRVLARVLGQLGYTDRLADVVPELSAPIDFDEEARLAGRQRARSRRRNLPPT